MTIPVSNMSDTHIKSGENFCPGSKDMAGLCKFTPILCEMTIKRGVYL